VPEGIDLLHIWVKGEVIKGELIFSNLVDIPSYPEEFLGLRDYKSESLLLDPNFLHMSLKQYNEMVFHYLKNRNRIFNLILIPKQTHKISI